MMELADVRELGAAVSAKGFAAPFSVRPLSKMKYAPVMELVDMRDLGAVTSVKV